MMSAEILVINAGSSSVKFSTFAVGNSPLEKRVSGQVDGLGGEPRFQAAAAGVTMGERTWSRADSLDHAAATRFLIEWLEARFGAGSFVGVGHRVVHGGREFHQPVRITPAILGRLEALVPLAPLHQPNNLLPIRTIAQVWPELPQVASFDTAFHRGGPEIAELFALPRQLAEAGIRRYGFHGLSYEYIAGVLPTLDPRAAAGRVVVAHLGSGASMCALAGGRSIASSMGFTALDGLPMSTRAGSLDPGVLIFLLRSRGMDADQLEDLLYRRSGLLGVSEISSDMRRLLESSDPRAIQAVNLFVYRAQREVGSLAAALGGLDAIVFTAGIGEHSPVIRQQIGAGLAWLGLDWDEDANQRGGPRLSTRASAVSAWIIPTNEELMLARHAARVLGLSP